MGSRVRRLAEPIGRLLLLGAVVFWWGAIVLPQLISFTVPEMLPRGALPRHLNPDTEGSLANAVSAASFAVVALLALGNTSRSLRIQNAQKNWIAVGGWAALAVTAVYLTVDETVDPRTMSVFEGLGQTPFSETYKKDLWIVVFSPLIVAFVVAMGFFVLRGSLSRAVRVVLILGFTTWLLAILHDLNHEPLFEVLVSKRIGRLLEETLEFSGTLLVGLGAAISLWSRQEPASDMFDRFGNRYDRRGRFTSAVWSFDKFVMGAVAIVACIVVVGVLVPYLHKTPLADARADTNIGAFQIILYDKHSLVQELGVLPAPPSRLDLRIASRVPPDRPGNLIWRVIEAGEGGTGKIFREGRREILAKDHLTWETIGFPPPVEAEGHPLALQLIADVGPSAHLRIGATKTNRYEEGRLWVDGALSWPDQNIEFVAYSEPDPTRNNPQAMWHIFLSDWRWPALAADLAIVMALLIFVPALLIIAAVPRRAAVLAFGFTWSILRRRQTALGGLCEVNPTTFATTPQKENEVLRRKRQE